MTDKPKKLERTSAGLRNALFDELDSLRNGDENIEQARTVANLTNAIIQVVNMELRVMQAFGIKTNQGNDLSKLPPINLVTGSLTDKSAESDVPPPTKAQLMGQK